LTREFLGWNQEITMAPLHQQHHLPHPRQGQSQFQLFTPK
jgi:hypothetical protein